MSETPTLRHLRLAAARAHKSNVPPEKLIEVQRDYAAEKIAAHVEAVVASAPELSPEQVSRIAALLGGSAS